MKLFSAGSLPTGIRVRQTFHTIIHARRSDLGSRAPGSIDDRSEGVGQEFIEMASGRHFCYDSYRRPVLRSGASGRANAETDNLSTARDQ